MYVYMVYMEMSLKLINKKFCQLLLVIWQADCSWQMPLKGIEEYWALFQFNIIK